VKPYFETEGGILYRGNALEVLKDMESESIDCVICSPPYWALRDYGIEPVIWDGDEDCEHEWGTKIKQKGHQHFRDFTWETGGQPKEKESVEVQEIDKGNFCTKCGAWQGSLGLESTFQLYIQHLIQIFDEIKRVLKKTGTCWVNIGDSYSGTHVEYSEIHPRWQHGEVLTKEMGRLCKELPLKCLCQIPERFSIAMTDRGWIKRNTIIWFKSYLISRKYSNLFVINNIF